MVCRIIHSLLINSSIFIAPSRRIRNSQRPFLRVGSTSVDGSADDAAFVPPAIRRHGKPDLSQASSNFALMDSLAAGGLSPDKLALVATMGQADDLASSVAHTQELMRKATLCCGLISSGARYLLTGSSKVRGPGQNFSVSLLGAASMST